MYLICRSSSPIIRFLKKLSKNVFVSLNVLLNLFYRRTIPARLILHRLEIALHNNTVDNLCYVQQVHYSVLDDELYKVEFTGKYWANSVNNSQPPASVGLNVHWFNFQHEKPILEFLMTQFISIK